MTLAASWNATGQTELTLARAIVLFRLAALAEIAIVTGYNASGYSGHTTVVVMLLAGIAAESAILCTACLRAGRVRSWWAVADLAFTIAVLAASAMATVRYGGLYVAYPYSVICSVAFGVGLRRLSAVLTATVFLTAGYLYGGGYLHADPAANVVVNAITYFPNTLVAWAVARQLRRMGRELEVSRSREAALARDQERLRHARLLHDRVLQTMETLAGGQWIADVALKARVAEEAGWLRGLVEGTSEAAGGDLLGQLSELTARAARDGLHVEFNYATLRGTAILGALDSQRSAALAGAVSEALTNVVKHAATASAVLRLAAKPAALVVTVLDRGRGFDPATQPEGMGLKESVRGRVTEAGGTVRIDTAPGVGTYLEITIPRSARWRVRWPCSSRRSSSPDHRWRWDCSARCCPASSGTGPNPDPDMEVPGGAGFRRAPGRILNRPVPTQRNETNADMDRKRLPHVSISLQPRILVSPPSR